MTTATVRRRVSDYKSDVKPIWCPGCGNYAVLSALYRALADLNIPPEKVAIASGIGCSGRFPAFVRAYGFHGVHGRALPLATGIKLGNPELTVFAVGGDGDAFSIGGGHILHAARRNVDVTYIVMDNRIYGLTKGQPSPTSAQDMRTKASPYGTMESPMNPVATLLSYYATFVARGVSTDPRMIAELIKRAVQHPGFSFIHVVSPCVSFNDLYDMIKRRQTPIPPDHDVTDHDAAMDLTLDREHLYVGVFYQDDRPGYVEMLRRKFEPYISPDYTARTVIERFCVTPPNEG